MTLIVRLVKKFVRSWRIRTDPVAYARGLGVRVGEGCRLIATHHGTFGTEPYLISLGDHVTITNGVQFVTHDGGVWVFREHHPDIDVIAPITVGNNVFIGINTILMPGVGKYKLIFKLLPPSSGGLGRHTDPVTGVADWWAPYETTYAWDYKGLAAEKPAR